MEPRTIAMTNVGSPPMARRPTRARGRVRGVPVVSLVMCPEHAYERMAPKVPSAPHQTADSNGTRGGSAAGSLWLDVGDVLRRPIVRCRRGRLIEVEPRRR